MGDSKLYRGGATPPLQKVMRKPKASPPQWGSGAKRRWGILFRTVTPLAAPQSRWRPATKNPWERADARSVRRSEVTGFCAGRQKSRPPVPLLEAVSNREPGNALFRSIIPGTSEPTASTSSRRIWAPFAASLNSAKVRQPARSAVGRFAGVRRASVKTVAAGVWGSAIEVPFLTVKVQGRRCAARRGMTILIDRTKTTSSVWPSASHLSPKRKALWAAIARIQTAASLVEGGRILFIAHAFASTTGTAARRTAR